MQITGFHSTHRKTDQRQVQVMSLTDQQGRDWTAFSLGSRFELSEQAIQIRFDQRCHPWVLYRNGGEADTQARLEKVVEQQFSETSKSVQRSLLSPGTPKLTIKKTGTAGAVKLEGKTTVSRLADSSTTRPITKPVSLGSADQPVLSRSDIPVRSKAKTMFLSGERKSESKETNISSVFAPPNPDKVGKQPIFNNLERKPPTEADFKAAELELPPWEISQLLPNQETEESDPCLEATYLPPVKSSWWQTGGKGSLLASAGKRQYSRAEMGLSLKPLYYRPRMGKALYGRPKKRGWKPWQCREPRLIEENLPVEPEDLRASYRWQKVKTDITTDGNEGDWNPEGESLSLTRDNNWAMMLSAVLAIGGVAYLLLPVSWLPFG